MASVYFGFTIIAILVLVHCGNALRCWRCSSDLNIECMDYFNTTKIQQQRQFYQNVSPDGRGYNRIDMPLLSDCSDNLGQLYGQSKQVCLKKVMTVPGGRQITSRECKTVNVNQEMGKCPPDPVARGSTVDFCEYCDRDGCNAATGLTATTIMWLAPIACTIYLLK